MARTIRKKLPDWCIRVRILLEKRGMTMRELAKAIYNGKNESLVAQFLGDFRPPTDDFLIAAARVLGTTVDYILHGDGTPLPVQLQVVENRSPSDTCCAANDDLTDQDIERLNSALGGLAKSMNTSRRVVFYQMLSDYLLNKTMSAGSF